MAYTAVVFVCFEVALVCKRAKFCGSLSYIAMMTEVGVLHVGQRYR
jgi:hypothetical protein